VKRLVPVTVQQSKGKKNEQSMPIVYRMKKKKKKEKKKNEEEC
jgi:hypothetical protein